MLKKSLSSLLLIGATLAQGQESTPCDTEFGVCLDGKRSDFFPDLESIASKNCVGYPNLTIYCYINRGKRDFSWKVTPARAYKAEHDLFMSDGYMYVESQFPILHGSQELEALMRQGENYTFNVSFSVDLDAYDPLYFRSSRFGYKAGIALMCDGQPLAVQAAFSSFRPGSFGGFNTKPETFTAVFSEVPANACQESIAVRLDYEGQKLRVKNLSLAILNEH